MQTKAIIMQKAQSNGQEFVDAYMSYKRAWKEIEQKATKFFLPGFKDTPPNYEDVVNFIVPPQMQQQFDNARAEMTMNFPQPRICFRKTKADPNLRIRTIVIW